MLASIDLISKLIKDLPKMNFERNKVCDVCHLKNKLGVLSNLKILFQLLDL